MLRISLISCTTHISCNFMLFIILQEGMTGLCCAAREGHTEVVELLLTQGAYVNVQDKVE